MPCATHAACRGKAAPQRSASWHTFAQQAACDAHGMYAHAAHCLLDLMYVSSCISSVAAAHHAAENSASLHLVLKHVGVHIFILVGMCQHCVGMVVNSSITIINNNSNN
jgi:hypothetical protein